MQRILDPARIEAFAERSIPRVRFPDPASLFARRAERLRALAENHSLGDYLRLMAAVADAQQEQLEALRATLICEQFAEQVGEQLELAHAHRMPLLQAAGWPRQDRWRAILAALCTFVGKASGFPDGVRSVCERIVASLEPQGIAHVGGRIEGVDARADGRIGGRTKGKGADAEALSTGRAEVFDVQADALLAGRTEGIDARAAPFVMAALQVYWVAMASTLRVSDVEQLDVAGVCPMCGTLPVSSVVRSDKGYRYLHCALCATEWHMVRITCSHCLANEGIAYHAIEGGTGAVRAESCGQCHTYRKILYEEKDTNVDPVADDLASLALDLLMTEEGFHRGSGNPLLWQNTEA